MKILYVEDEIAHVILTERTLEENLHQEFQLLHTESIADALKLLDTEPDIDLVLSDLYLPDGQGLDLLKKIRERKEPPPVVIVTGQGDQEIAIEALKAGAADYLVKQRDYLHRLPVVISNAIAQDRYLREQEALRKAEVKYQSLIEQIPAVIFLTEAKDTRTLSYINSHIKELTGYTPEEWLADPDIWIKSIHPEDRKRVSEQGRISSNTGSHFLEEYRMIRRDGRIIWIKEDTNLVKKGNPPYWQGMLLDITKEKESEAGLLAKQSVKNQDSSIMDIDLEITKNATRAFVSYSWDNNDHKKWVRELAARLRNDGIDVTLDQWNLVPGDRIPEFMERAVRESDYVLIVCTHKYRERSNNRQGGVGYEGDIMTAEALSTNNQRKFIPILRQQSWAESAPNWLSGKYYIDLSSSPYSQESYKDLLATLLGTREKAPPVGNTLESGNPFHNE